MAVRELPEACGLMPGHQERVVPLGPSAVQLEELKKGLKSTKKRKRKEGAAEGAQKVASSSGSSSSSSSTASAKSVAPKKKFKSAEALFTQGFGFGQ